MGLAEMKGGYMGHYVTIYRWKPENAMAFAKKYANFVPGYPGPQKLKDAAAKLKNVSFNYSPTNSCIVVTYDCADEDLIEVNACAIHLADVCTIETFPALNADDYAKALDTYADMVPEFMEQMTKE